MGTTSATGGGTTTASTTGTTTSTGGATGTTAQTTSTSTTGPGPTDMGADGWCDGPGEEVFTIRQVDDYQVDTSISDQYLCVGLTVTTDELRHVVSFRPIVNNPFLLHHMIVYRVDQADPPDPFPCANIPDSGFRYGWAPGVGQFDLPAEAGFVMGDADGDSNTPGIQTFYRLEIHYNVPDTQNPPPDDIDSSGVEICTTKTLRPNDASALALGDLELNIPPGVPDHEEIGVCSETSTSLLPWDIHVFASFPHMHLLGRQIWTDHLRGGQKIGVLGEGLNFDFNLQKTILEDETIKAGDRLETHCVYDSTSCQIGSFQTNACMETTTFGEGTTDEMCFNFLFYWPALPGQIPPCVQ